MTAVNMPTESLPAVSDFTGVQSRWDWKQSFVDKMANGFSLDIFSESSVTPDTTLLLAGPARIAEEGIAEKFRPLGLVTDISFSIDTQLRPLWEMGTDVTYFTRGKAMNTLTIGAMVGYKPSLLNILTRYSPVETDEYPTDVKGQFWVDPSTQTVAKPFGILMIMKAKGGNTVFGDFVGAVYLENCNIGTFNFSLNSSQAVFQENVTIMFDRAIPVDYGDS